LDVNPVCGFSGIYFGVPYAQIGSIGTFFGPELGVVEDQGLIDEFSFNLGHAQNKATITLLLGVWFAFVDNAKIGSITGLCVLSCLVQIIVESV
jgi:hypothetical protein